MESNLLSTFINKIKENPKQFFGALMGLIGAILILLIGFFKTLFIYLLVFIGSYIGKTYDRGETFKDIVISFLNKIKRNYM